MEEWKPIKGYEGLYEVSNYGRVKSLNRITCYGRKLKEKILAYRFNHGYLECTLCKNGKIKTHYIHKLVAETFIENPKNKPCINHINGNKQNNKVDNLEWCTYSENMKHAYKKGLTKVVNRKLSKEDITYIKSQRGKKTCFELAKEFNVSFQLISKKWREVGEL